MGDMVGSRQKFLILLLLFTMTISLTSCGNSGPRTTTIEEQLKYHKEDSAEGRSARILKCLSEDDKETLKDMFSPKAKRRKRLDKEIDKAMRFFDGKAVDGWKVQGGSGGAAYDYGKITYKEANPYIYPLKTNTGKVYAIYGYSYIVNKKEPDRVGLNAITIIEAPDDNYTDYSNAPEVTIGTP